MNYMMILMVFIIQTYKQKDNKGMINMHILQINAVNGIKSTGRTVKELDEYLTNVGIESSIAYSEGENSFNSYKIGAPMEKKIHGLFSRITGLQGYFSKRGTKKLIQYIESIQPDVIHIRNLHSNFINLPMLFEYISKNRIVTVITLHDCWFYTGGHTHYFSDNFYDWEKGFRHKNRNKKNVGNPSWFFDRSEKIFQDQKKWISNIDPIIFVGVSKWISSEAEKSEVTDNAHITTIYNWIDTDTFKNIDASKMKERLGITQKFVILGVASIWNNKKGIKKFIELSKVLNDDEVIILVGNLLEVDGLPTNIINIKETNNIHELVKIYSMADVFLNLSIEESFGKVTAEALSCGLPVISNPFTANAELVGLNCGYTLSNLSIENIFNTIQEVKLKGKSYYSTYCIKYARENFSMEVNVKKYINLYKEIIKSEEDRL